MNGLDLFSGIGGLTRALDGYVRPVAYCEIEPYARAVLLSRIVSGDLPEAPIWDDVSSLKGSMLPTVDIIYGGFPCQDLSVAGRGEGLEGKRSGLFFEIVRLAEEIKPKFIFLENVPNIRTKGLSRVIAELARLRYDCRWGFISAADVGAPHKRERWFLLAYSRCSLLEGTLEQGTVRVEAKEQDADLNQRSGEMADPNQSGLQGRDSGGLQECSSERIARPSNPQMADTPSVDGTRPFGKRDPFGVPQTEARNGSCAYGDFWIVEPPVGRVANGIPKRVDRLRALGNAVVPAQAREAFERLMGD